MQLRRKWSEIFEVLREKKNHQPRIVKLTFKNEEEIDFS